MNNIPIVPSLILDSKKIHELDGEYFYVYEWFDGKTLKNQDITKVRQKISAALSQIYNIEIKNQQYQRNSIAIDWDYYI